MNTDKPGTHPQITQMPQISELGLNLRNLRNLRIPSLPFLSVSSAFGRVLSGHRGLSDGYSTARELGLRREAGRMAARRYIVIVNPRGGRRRGPAVLERVRPVFAAAGAELEVHVTERPGHAAELAATLDLAASDGLCVVGGDGTVREAVCGLMRRGRPDAVPLGIIPAGTGNAAAEHLGCADPAQAARRIVAGGTRPLDVARVTMGGQVTYSVGIVGWGCAVDINRTAERLRAIGPPRYALAALAHVLRARRRQARVTLDGRVLEDGFLMVVGCNMKFTGRGMRIAPAAEMDDGLLDVILVRQATRMEMLRLLARIFDGSHILMDCVEHHRVHRFAIEPEGQDALNLDGDIAGTTPVAVEVAPGALRVFA
jgi:YegS/Rv2252/BmrU family lipid kinase